MKRGRNRKKKQREGRRGGTGDNGEGKALRGGVDLYYILPYLCYTLRAVRSTVADALTPRHYTVYGDSARRLRSRACSRRAAA